MSGATGALYEVLIERDLDAVPSAVSVFLETQSADDLRIAVTRFAVLAFAPSLHSKRALLACRAAGEVRDECGAEWIGVLAECARYAAESRPPWSDPPPLDPPAFDESAGKDDLAAVIASGDRLRAERWLAARIDRAGAELALAADGDALLLLDAALALEPPLGERGRYSLLRTVVWEMVANPMEPSENVPFTELVQRATRERGAIESVSAVFVAEARRRLSSGELVIAAGKRPSLPLEPYHFARDFAQTLIAHAVARHLPFDDAHALLAAVHENLEHGESFAEWA